VPAEPPPTRWAFPPASDANDNGVVGLGADLEPGTLLAAYRVGLFPMPVARGRRVAWWSPDPRGIIPLDGLRTTRSLRRSCRRYEVRIDTAFVEVVEACASADRDGGWITTDVVHAYARLHELGWAHSVETWNDDGELVGGLYGVALGGFFAGESMFHNERDASKVALVELVTRLDLYGASLLDVQWTTPHLRSLGAVDVPRDKYLEMLGDAINEDAAPFELGG
jgi:leucyl/phenylalanyl-tRNA--protein transferase